jgi:hypothetical protein
MYFPLINADHRKNSATLESRNHSVSVLFVVQEFSWYKEALLAPFLNRGHPSYSVCTCDVISYNSVLKGAAIEAACMYNFLSMHALFCVNSKLYEVVLFETEIMRFPVTSFVGISLAALLLSLLHGQTYLIGFKIGMISRIIMTGAVYQKVLSLNQVTVGRLSIGRIVNLASNDVQRFDMVCCIPSSSLLLHYNYTRKLRTGMYMVVNNKLHTIQGCKQQATYHTRL